MSGQPLIEIRDDMGMDAEVVMYGTGYKIVAGPNAPLGALHKVINDLAERRATNAQPGDDQDGPEIKLPTCRMIRRTMGLGYVVPMPRFVCQRQPTPTGEAPSTEPDCCC